MSVHPRHYETVCIVNPDIGEGAIKEVVTKATGVIREKNGVEVDVEEWGRRRLAYPILKKSEGHYVVFTYTSPPEASKELERTFKFNEDVLRYQTVALKQREPKAPEPATEPTPEAKPEPTPEAKPESTTEAKPEPTSGSAPAEPAPEKSASEKPSPEKSASVEAPEASGKAASTDAGGEAGVETDAKAEAGSEAGAEGIKKESEGGDDE